MILIATSAALLVLLGACSADGDAGYFGTQMYATNRGTFINKWKNDHARAIGVSRANIEQRWDNGHGQLDTNAAKAAWWDMSTDFCSNSPDTGLYFDFKEPCTRHDWGWRNLKRLDRHWNCPGIGVNKPCGTSGLPPGAPNGFSSYTNRRGVNNVFLADMQDHCGNRSPAFWQHCYGTALIYYGVVELAA